MTNEPDTHALSGAYAVDALDDLERIRFERHLATCSECRAEVASLRESNIALSELTSTAPPPQLRSLILNDIKSVRPMPPQVPASSRRRRRRFRLAPLAAAAALVATAGIGTVVVINHSGPKTTQTASVAARVLHADDARSVSVDLPGPAMARVVRSVSVGKAVLVTQDMTAPPAGKVYQLWLQNAVGQMIPAGLMPPGSNQTVVLKGDAAHAKAAGITVEPAAGSSQPTSAPLALFDFERAT